MEAAKAKRGGAPDRSRVNVDEAYQVRYWTRKLACTEAQLRECVAAVGALGTDVEKHFRTLAGTPSAGAIEGPHPVA